MGEVHNWPEIDRIAAEIAAERPDHVARAQYYTWSPNGERERPCCLVGHIADRLGIEIPVHESDEEDGGVPVSNLFRLPAFAGHFTAGARRYLMDLQLRQDDGMSWGEAVKRSRETTRFYARKHGELNES